MHPKKIRASEYAQKECFVGRHLDEIILGDAFDFLPLMRDESVELVLTDVPYGVVNRTNGGLRSFNKGTADDAEELDIDRLLPEIVRICRGSVYIFCSTEQASAIRSGLDARGLTTRLCIWDKQTTVERPEGARRRVGRLVRRCSPVGRRRIQVRSTASTCGFQESSAASSGESAARCSMSLVKRIPPPL